MPPSGPDLQPCIPDLHPHTTLLKVLLLFNCLLGLQSRCLPSFEVLYTSPSPEKLNITHPHLILSAFDARTVVVFRCPDATHMLPLSHSLLFVNATSFPSMLAFPRTSSYLLSGSTGTIVTDSLLSAVHYVCPYQHIRFSGRL
jgi:hypothetical protein